MRHTRRPLRSTTSLLLVSLMAFVQATVSADCPEPALVDFTGAPPVVPADLENPAVLAEKRDKRAMAVQAFSEGLALDFKDSCNRQDIGQAFHHRLFAHLASTKPEKRQAAIDFLRNLQRDDFGEMGTTAPLGDFCENTIEDVVGFLPDLATDLGRHGEGDIGMIGLVAALHKYGNVLPPDVTSHVLSLIDEEPTIGGVETVSFGLSTGAIVSICGLVCTSACSAGPIPCGICVAGCAAALEGESILAPETENHLNNIYVAQYLANQKRFDLTGNPKYDNARNGYRAKMIARMHDFVRNDFIEYNAHPYQTYTMFALLTLASFAKDTAVKDAAAAALHYVSAKVAVSSNDLIRSTPFRRRNEPNHLCDDLFCQCVDPQSPFYLMLTGLTHTFGEKSPAVFAENFGWVAATGYELPKIILDLFVNQSHRKFYQFIHYERVLQFDGFSDSNDELYFGSPSYLISAGGRPAHFAYTATVPFPINLIPFIGGEHPGSNVDIGITVPTTLMPTGDPERSHNRKAMISFHENAAENLGVAPNFACGLNPNVPGVTSPGAEYPGRVPDATVTTAGLDPMRWKVFDRKGSAGPYGYYVAVYQQDDFGFFEVYDTFTDAQSLPDVGKFLKAIHDNNPNLMVSRDGVNTYKTVDGTVIEFLCDAKIVTLNGIPPIRDRTNGDVIDNDGQGVVTIKNPALPNETLTLNAAIPPDHPTISVPGPVHFPDTCLGETSYETLYICNVSSTGEDLFVYNIVPNNTQFTVVEPTSGYPIRVSHDFCYPFQVQYTPTVWGSLASKLVISSSDPTQEYLRVDIIGEAPPPVVSTAIADSGAFGDVCRKTFKDLDLTISNGGGCDLLVTGISSSSAEFRTASVMNFPLVIRGGTSTHVAIRLAPTSLGAKSADIAIASNDPSTPSKVIPVTGNTPPGSLRLTGSTDFGDVCAGTLAEKQLAVCNVGICDLNVSSAAFVGACADFTLIRNPFPAAVSPDSCEDLTIRFTPTSCGPKTCTLRIATDDPDALTTDVSVIANTPCPRIDVPPDKAFPPTVIQGVGACQSQVPFPISNTGTCNLIITNIAIGGADGSDYSLSGLPSFPIILQPGHVVGEGNLRIVFKPTAVDRDRLGTVTVTYESDPITHATTDVTRLLCGEGVRTGARVLVRAGGVPVGTVEKIQLQRINANRNKQELDTNDVAMNVALQTVPPAPPCAQFQYHREYGTVSNAIQLLPGSYQVTATAIVNRKRLTKTVGFSVDTCGFNPTILIDF